MGSPVIRAAVSCAVLTSVASAPSRSGASEKTPVVDDSVTMIIPGYLYGAMHGTNPARAHGAEVSVLHVFDAKNWLGVGLLAQLQSYDGETARTALAGEVTWGPLGLELGWARRGASAPHPAQHGVHVAPYFSLGVVAIGYRLTAPIGDGDANWGFEHGFVLKLGLPIPVQNWQNLGHLYPMPVSTGGRPLRDAHGDCVLPTVVEGRRGRARARFIAEARMEHASIESFLRLADDLDALSAPTTLVARALAAAEDERRHAAQCLSWAGGGVTLRSQMGALGARTRRPRPDPRRMAREAWVDGVLGEGRAARMLLREAARHPKRAAGLVTIAVEEAAHAWLAADVLRWLEERSPGALRG